MPKKTRGKRTSKSGKSKAPTKKHQKPRTIPKPTGSRKQAKPQARPKNATKKQIGLKSVSPNRDGRGRFITKKAAELREIQYSRGPFAIDVPLGIDLPFGPLNRDQIVESVSREATRIKEMTVKKMPNSDIAFMFGHFRPDSTIAKNYSTLRWDVNAARLRERLELAMEEGRFDEMADEIADEYEVESREVYTLYWS